MEVFKAFSVNHCPDFFLILPIRLFLLTILNCWICVRLLPKVLVLIHKERIILGNPEEILSLNIFLLVRIKNILHIWCLLREEKTVVLSLWAVTFIRATKWANFPKWFATKAHLILVLKIWIFFWSVSYAASSLTLAKLVRHEKGRVSS
jgi:hypothetical protein